MSKFTRSILHLNCEAYILTKTVLIQLMASVVGSLLVPFNKAEIILTFDRYLDPLRLSFHVIVEFAKVFTGNVFLVF
jgi:hypothetical protein